MEKEIRQRWKEVIGGMPTDDLKAIQKMIEKELKGE